ncbi:MAG TPA: hypothetical protein VM432_12195, partial [Bdellovibrionales bacterium]|nr:hypothetical protein [Bdellovibrionales bacterium]
IDNTEAGIFETDYVKGDGRFSPAHESREFSSGYRYRLLVRMVRGKKEARSAVKVSITKQIQLARDFFSDPDELTSDGLEEKSILYRINREISIARGLNRAIEKQQGQSQQ